MVTESPPVSPSVVAAILMVQKTNVTSGTLLGVAAAIRFMGDARLGFPRSREKQESPVGKLSAKCAVNLASWMNDL
jgi:hypothetical protein